MMPMPYIQTRPPVLDKPDTAQVQNVDTSQINDFYSSPKRVAWGSQTNKTSERSQLQSKYTSSYAVRSSPALSPYASVNSRLFLAWSEQVQREISDWRDDSVASIVTSSERYLLALSDIADYRIFVSSLLNAFCFNSDISQDDAAKVGRLVGRFSGQELNRKDTVSFMRQLRELGYSPSAVRRQTSVQQA